MELYHVTTQKRAKNIDDNGIQNIPDDASWVRKRAEFREIIDRLGKKNYDNWVPRGKGVYFWTTLKDALNYTNHITSGIPVIVVIEPKGLNLWQVNNKEIEYLFDNYANDRFSEDEITVKIEIELLRYCKPYNGDENENIEVWGKPPIPTNNIRKYLNRNGYEIDDIDKY